jgi:hypothetical protein
MNRDAFISKIRCYLEMWIMLWESIQRKRPKLWPDKWILHNDNAPVHVVLKGCKFLAKKSL